METTFSHEKEELERVLSSGNFSRAPLQGKLLRFICQEYFAGRVDRIKEYTLATEVVGRGPDFDQNQDAIVRVEAHRLRKNLKGYYEGVGANNPVQIVLELGRYVPKFVTRTRASATAASADTAHPQSQGEPAVGVVQLRGGTSGPNVSRRARRTAAWVLAGLAVVLTLLLGLADFIGRVDLADPAHHRRLRPEVHCLGADVDVGVVEPVSTCGSVRP